MKENNKKITEYHFRTPELADFMGNIRREWAMTNGIGGYAGSSVLGAHNRTHQGYLIASLHPPVERYLVFSKINESIIQGNTSYDLETARHAASIQKGNQYLTDFIYDGTVRFRYRTGNITLEKNLALIQGENTVAISYEIINKGTKGQLRLTPLMNYREHSTSSTKETLHFSASVGDHFFRLVPKSNPEVSITLAFSEGQLQERDECYDTDMLLQTEVDNETAGLDCHYQPYDLVINLPENSVCRLSVICTVTYKEKEYFFPREEHYSGSITQETAFACIAGQRAFLESYVAQAGYEDEFANRLVLAGSQFLCRRCSTGLTTVLAGLPWFTDWGRDTMIAFTGLTLASKHYKEAEEILLTFARYIRNGIIPNMFPDNGTKPLYNTADASLWYFYAVYQYLCYVNTPEAYELVQNRIFPALEEIIHAYRSGTDFSIYMEEDGLVHAGSGLDQVTWMDVRVGDWVATPRHGKPVEINALWYNALKVMEFLCIRYQKPADQYTALAKKVKKAFPETFWNTACNCLYDVVDGTKKDASIRPNQIYAVSLPFTMLTPKQERSIVDMVHRELFAETGLCSLSPKDPSYHPVYQGSLEKRDQAYHQGTSWAFLLGGFYTAYMKVHGHSREAAQNVQEMLKPMINHICREGCIGSISEIFDGDAPHTSRGCYAQAWSVGEILRCYTQDVLPFIH